MESNHNTQAKLKDLLSHDFKLVTLFLIKYFYLNENEIVIRHLIIIHIQKKFGVVVSYRKTYLAHKIVLNQVYKKCFDRLYTELIPFLGELKSHDYQIEDYLIITYDTYFCWVFFLCGYFHMLV